MPTETVTLRTTKLLPQIMRAWVEGKRRDLEEGGTSSSKTFTVLQFLMLLAKQARDPLLISVVSESLPHLKRGAIRDWFTILNESQDNNRHWSKSEFVYSRKDWKGTLEFFGADDGSKVRGPRRDVLFINEGNNVPWEAARGLDIRTNKFTIVDWNPTGSFWVHEYDDGSGHMIPGWIKEPTSAYHHSTYKDALDVLPREVVENIESQQKDANWWRIYGLGLLGKLEGLVYPNFEQVDALPKGDAFFGLDFGFSNDPAALVKNVVIGGNLYSQELIYQSGLTNDDLARKMDLLGVRKNYDEIWADAAEPKSIEELVRKGYNVKPAEKGPGSVDYGHQKVRQFYQFWTKDSVHAIQEQRNFRYIMDRDGRLTDKTTHQWSHLMDARRYSLSSHSEGARGQLVQEYQPDREADWSRNQDIVVQEYA